MVRRYTCLLLLIFLVTWASGTEEATSLLAPLRTPERIETEAVRSYLERLAGRGVDLTRQGVRVESLDGGLIFADYQSDVPFNPASVMKVAVTTAALERFGPSHKFETAFLMDGVIENQTLIGDLILASDGDPVMGTSELVRMAREVVGAGIRRVDGSLVVAGPFTIGNLHRRDQVGRYLIQTLRRVGIRVPAEVTFGDVRGQEIVRRWSPTLRDIVFTQNSRSDNPTADRLGEAIGGREALTRYLVDAIGLPAEDVRVSRASGLRINRLTAEGTVTLLRRLGRVLDRNGMYPEDILPVAGLDQGTTRQRFNSATYRGSVVAKTGTLVSTDGGVSTLAGFLYTEDAGPLLFAVFNTRGPVLEYRRFQDEFIKELIDEQGGKARSDARTHRSAS